MPKASLIRSVWPLPGGKDQYLSTLDQIMMWVAETDTPTRASFGVWLKEQFEVNSEKTVDGYLNVVLVLGMLDQGHGKTLTVSTVGQQFLGMDNLRKARLVIERFMTGYLAFPEILAEYANASKPLHLEILVSSLQPHFPRWTTKAQFEYRVMWLLSLGCLRQVKGRTHEITDLGREISRQYPGKASGGAERVEQNGQLSLIKDAEQTTERTPDFDSVEQTAPQEGEVNSPTPHLPLYSQARNFLAILDGVPYSHYRSMYNEIWSQRGNPQAQADWLEPEVWIPERLSETERDLAWRIWRESKKNLNPRYSRGSWYFAGKHDLLTRDQADLLTVTDRGRRFLEESDPAITVQIDHDEGILEVLRTVAEKGPGRRSEFLDEYAAYSRQKTTIQSLNVIKSYLYNRLQNLIERGLVASRGQSYEVTDAGLAYLEEVSHLLADGWKTVKPKSDIRKLAKEMRDKAREELADYLAAMDPFKFEELIKLLLEEMGYEEVTVTSSTNDKGVDVVAHIELGISSVREVIQAKRHKGSINRTVMDQLRGSLHRFDAVRGTIITTGRFSKGVQQAAFERGAAPITLIDGDKLLDLLMDHQIGVVKRTVDYYDFDSTKLQQFESESVTDALTDTL